MERISKQKRCIYISFDRTVRVIKEYRVHFARRFNFNRWPPDPRTYQKEARSRIYTACKSLLSRVTLSIILHGSIIQSKARSNRHKSLALPSPITLSIIITFSRDGKSEPRLDSIKQRGA